MTRRARLPLRDHQALQRRCERLEVGDFVLFQVELGEVRALLQAREVLDPLAGLLQLVVRLRLDLLDRLRTHRMQRRGEQRANRGNPNCQVLARQNPHQRYLLPISAPEHSC